MERTVWDPVSHTSHSKRQQQLECFGRLDVTTNNPAVQVYTGFWLDTPRKEVHGGPTLNYTKWSAVAIEQEGYIDAINTPEWGVDQICLSFLLVLTAGRRYG